MGKLSYNDKLRMQTLREQGLGGKAISSYRYKGWEFSTVKKVCIRVDRLAQPFCVNQAVQCTCHSVCMRSLSL